jgi:hypothetical protein
MCNVCVPSSSHRARVTYPNGDTFEGSFNDAKVKDGPGVYTWSLEEGANPWLPEGGLPEGRVVKYEGSWSNGKRSGIGKMFYPNGDRYHGTLRTCGFVFSIGVTVPCVYGDASGLWANNKPNGEGTYFYANGDLYRQAGRCCASVWLVFCPVSVRSDVVVWCPVFAAATG